MNYSNKKEIPVFVIANKDCNKIKKDEYYEAIAFFDTNYVKSGKCFVVAKTDEILGCYDSSFFMQPLK